MKNYFLFLIFISLTIIPTQAQIASGEITYKVTADEVMMDSILNAQDSQDLSNYLKMMFKNQVKTLPYLFYHLEFNPKESRFYIPKSMQNDNNLDLETTTKNVGAYGVYYINSEDKKSYHQFTYGSSDLIVIHPTNEFVWKISEETKVIEGYLCYKATTTHKPDAGLGGEITAWFTPDIPFQIGPLVYAGLPGLILELKQGYYTFTANNINLSEKEINIKKPKKGKIIKSKDLEQEKHKIKIQYMRMRSSEN